MPDPPFLESQKRPEWRAITAITADLLNWQPGYPYMGTREPLQGPLLPAAQVIVPNPPFLEAQKRPEWRTITAVSFLTWVPDWPYIGMRQPLQGRLLPPSLILVPNPPFPGDLDPRLLYLQRLLWEPPPPQVSQARKLSAGIPGQSVDPAPLIYQVIRDEILRLWDPPPPQAPIAGKLSPGIPGQSVDLAPFRSLDLRSTLVSFLPGAAIILPRTLSPGIPGQSIDRPPGLIRQVLFSDQLVIPVQARILRPIIGVDSPPFSLPADWLWTTLLAWQLERQPPTRLARLIQASGAPPVTTTTPNILDLLDLLTVLK